METRRSGNRWSGRRRWNPFRQSPGTSAGRRRSQCQQGSCPSHEDGAGQRLRQGIQRRLQKPELHLPSSGCRDLNPGPLDPQSSALTKLRHSPFLFRATFCPVYCDPIWSVSSNSKFTTLLAQSGGSRSIPHRIPNALDSLNRERRQPVAPKTCWLRDPWPRSRIPRYVIFPSSTRRAGLQGVDLKCVGGEA